MKWVGFALVFLAGIGAGCLSESGELDFRPLATATPTITAIPVASAIVKATATPTSPLASLTPPCETDACWLDLAKSRSDASLCRNIDADNRADYLDCHWTLAYRLQDDAACEGMPTYGAECVALAHRDANECGKIQDQKRRENCFELFKVIQEAVVE
ncbi:MAG: hypothetical protein Q8P02_01245 [Candidatus Micrarchaeota archaeon]|nr:hypothetical protein [Candidatus Micrarchaeota archaeon]